MLLRPATRADFKAVLALNEESVAYLSPLDELRLADLHDAAALHLVVEENGVVIAFLIALCDGASYDSPNYLWFARRYERFLYVDRVVVASGAKSRGAGSMLYRELFAFAQKTLVPYVTCEYDVEPPNARSERFHRRFGFREVGRQVLGDGRKTVSLQAVHVGE
jgi:predicted GNAT superfamily acetyltransferase